MKKISLLLLALGSSLGAFAQETVQQVPDGPWSLMEAVEYAWNNNIQVQQSQLQVETGEINYLQSKLNRVPSLNGQATHSYAFGRSIDPFTNQFTTDPIRFNNFSLFSSVDIFAGFQVHNQIKARYALLQAARDDARSAKNMVGLQVTNAYLQVLLNQELASIARLQVQTSQQQRERTQRLVEAGSLPQANLYDVESQLATDEVTSINADNNLEIARLSLLQALQLPATQQIEIEPIEVDMSGLALTTTSAEEIYNIALTNQPEIQAAQNRQKGSLFSLQAAKGTMYPTLSVSGNITTQYSSIGADQQFFNDGTVEVEIGYLQNDPAQKVFSTQPNTQVIVSEIPFRRQIDFNRRENISFNLNIPIFNNYQARSQVGLAKIETRNADLQLISAKNELRTSIEQSYADARAAAKRYAALEKQVAALELAFRNAETRRDVGAISTYDYTFAKNNLDSARAELSQAKYTYVFRLKVLDFYMGNPLSFE